MSTCRTRSTPRPAALRAFTLIELLTVIAVIAILVAITFATTTRMRTTADEARCVSNLRNLAMAGLAYANDNHGTMPDLIYWRERNASRARYSLLPYLYGHTKAHPTDIEYTDQSLLSCPLIRNNSQYSVKVSGAQDTATYSMNVYVHGSNVGTSKGIANYDEWAEKNALPGSIDGFHRPAQVPFFMDGTGTSDSYGRRYSTFQDRQRARPVTGTFGSGWHTPYLHRNNSVAVVFLDGHVRQVDYDWLGKQENWHGN